VAISLPIVAVCAWLFFSSWKDSLPAQPTVSLPPGPPKLSHDQALAKAALSLKPIAIPAAISITPRQKSAAVPALVDSAQPPSMANIVANAGLADVPQMRWKLAEAPKNIDAGQASSMDWDVALHPSLKYSGGAAVPLIATQPQLQTAALSVPLIDLNPHPTTAPTTRPAARSAPESVESIRSRLIADNLRMEDARKFVMSLCQDQQGCIWVGCEEDKPGTGGVQRFDPSAPELHQWTQFTTNDGLGDNNGYAIACDRKGRIWVGHLNHGVSVYNGQKWQNYEVVGGLSRPDTLSGPLGERVFAIKVCDKTGDVWISTNCGLSVYSESSDTWHYITRADGLPSDQSNAIAFDADGNVYLGTQCDGIAMANAADNYKTWRTVTGPDQAPLVPAGPGLPTSLINDLLVAHDGTVYAATTTGLAWSKDHGDTWQFLRGKDWEAKVRGLYGGAPKGWKPIASQTLAEDYCTCLADQVGGLAVGHRELRSETLSADGTARVNKATLTYLTAILPLGDGALLASYGDGLAVSGEPRSWRDATRGATTALGLPSAAGAVIAGSSNAPATDKQKAVRYLGEDWSTEGDFVGRYGVEHAMLCAAMAPASDQELSLLWNCRIQGQMGPNHKSGDSLRHWIRAVQTDDPRALYDPAIGIRRQAEWDDHGEEYPVVTEGPDIHVDVHIPGGTHRISLYFVNDDRKSGRTRFRDYVVELRPTGGGAAASWDGPPLAKTRVQEFYGGAYKTFLAVGPAEYVVRIARNGSFNTICSGIFIDGWPTTESPPGLTYPYMGDVKYGPPIGTEARPPALPRPGVVIVRPHPPRDRYANMDRSQQVTDYRAVLAIDPASPLCALLRWDLHLWSLDDRRQFSTKMLQAWSRIQQLNPFLRDPHWRPYSPGISIAQSDPNTLRKEQ
jgi:hypothetical protein